MPSFGRDLLAEFPLDPSITYLNHGTVGVTPRRVLAAQQAIRDEIERLSGERQWDEDGRNSIVLAKDARLRVLLTLLREGARVGDDDAEGPMSVQVLGGRVVARRDRHAVELHDGEMATIEAGAAWAVEAQEDSAILLTITWPPERAGV